MSADAHGIVWVLGSGFSRPLGGPLLKDLLSPRLGAIVAARYQEKEQRYSEARQLFAMREHYGLWEDAEGFLDMLDHARSDPGLADLIQNNGGEGLGIEDMWRFGLLAVADDCRFCDVDRTGTEAWRPYKRWAKDMGTLDHIITFNYDTVLESLRIATPLPGEDIDIRAALKLHGSVDWAMHDGQLARGVNRGQEVPFIATPGPTKLGHTEKGPLKPLWDYAKKALSQADAIVFMGYRFPPSDSYALSSLLGAIFENKSDVLRLHTVLGPRVNDDDTVRLKMLLQRTVRAAGRKIRNIANDRPAYSIQVHPLYAQDFMATFTETELLSPPPEGDHE